jgi:hypothetical protein
MEKTTFVHVARPNEDFGRADTKPAAIRWRFPALLFTPFVLCGLNLVEAKYEKYRGFEVGTLKYGEFRGRAEAIRIPALHSGLERGKNKKSAILAEARSQARADIEIGMKEKETRIEQGKAAGVIKIALANGMILAMFGRFVDIAKLIHERAEVEAVFSTGRYMQVDRKTGTFSVRTLITDARSRDELHDRMWKAREELSNRIALLSERAAEEGARELVSVNGFCDARGQR